MMNSFTVKTSRDVKLAGHSGASAPKSAPKSTLYEQIYRIVREIPFGRVCTYGQIARWAGLPGYARQVGYALFRGQDPALPWHRVVNAQGRVSYSAFRDGSDDLQKVLLEAEGIRFGADGRIDLTLYACDLSGFGQDLEEPRGGSNSPHEGATE